MEIKIELRQYLVFKGWDWKPAGDGKNIKVKVCPFCKREKWKFQINASTTQFRCLSASCGIKGNLYSLKVAQGDARDVGKKTKHIDLEKINEWNKALLESPESLQECLDRGLTTEAISHFKLGLRRKDGIRWLVIPHIFDDICWNLKMRALDEVDDKDKWRRVEGYKSVLFNADAATQNNEVVIAEAELDAVSLWIAGVKNVVALTCGAGTFLPEWFDLLHDKEEITLCLDADEAGQKGALDIARRLGYNKTKNVLLPLKDSNDVLRDLGPDILREALDKAERFEVAGIVSFDDAVCRRLEKFSQKEESGLFTPWPTVNALLGRRGFYGGDLIILSAKYKIGKTTLALQIADYLASSGVPSLFYCLEMGTDDLIDKVVSCVMRKDIDFLDPVDYTMARYILQQKPLYFQDKAGVYNASVDDIFTRIEDAIKRYGIKFLVFDHLHFLCRSISSVTGEIGQVTRRFKELAMYYGIPVVLLAQLRKIEGKRAAKSGDVKDSVSPATDCDRLILLHRDEILAAGSGSTAIDDDASDLDEVTSADDEVLSPKTAVKFAETRYSGRRSTTLWYDGPTATFYELDQHNRPILPPIR